MHFLQQNSRFTVKPGPELQVRGIWRFLWNHRHLKAACVEVTTSLEGNGPMAMCSGTFFSGINPVCVHVEINDCGATPGVVNLRLLQVLEKHSGSG